VHGCLPHHNVNCSLSYKARFPLLRVASTPLCKIPWPGPPRPLCSSPRPLCQIFFRCALHPTASRRPLKIAIIKASRKGTSACPSTNTSATTANLNSKKSSSTVSRKSPVPSAPAKKPRSSFPSLAPPSPAAQQNPPPAPQAAEAVAAAVAAATDSFSRTGSGCRIHLEPAIEK